MTASVAWPAIKSLKVEPHTLETWIRHLPNCSGSHTRIRRHTDYQSPEEVDALCDRTTPYAENWKPTADRLWESSKSGFRKGE